ncbi:MAG: AmmeMemoRadiSam system protein B, partial [Chrysiogenales bacterium]
MKLRKYFFLLLFPFMLMAADDIRPFLNTGPWYPSDPVQLNQMLDGFFKAAAQPQKPAAVRGIIAPHAGFQYSGRCAARAYGSLSPASGIRRVILLGSSHRSGFYGACLADYKSYATPLGLVAVDTEICRALAAKKFFNKNRDTMRLE